MKKEKKIILVVDDSELNRALLADMLRSEERRVGKECRL